jgi:hypothetical protein
MRFKVFVVLEFEAETIKKAREKLRGIGEKCPCKVYVSEEENLFSQDDL